MSGPCGWNNGLKDPLVEYFGCLGGNTATGLVNTFCGFNTRPNPVPVVTGVVGHIAIIH